MKKVEIEDFAKIKKLSDPVLSPSGKKLAVTVTEGDVEQNSYKTDIWVYDETHTPSFFRLTASENGKSPCFLDEETILFPGDRLKKHPAKDGVVYTVYNSISLNGGEATEGSEAAASVNKDKTTTVAFEDDYTDQTGSFELTKTIKGDITEEEANEIARVVGLGALKYFILKVDPRKNMLFNPEESIDFNGNTGPFIQYTYARIQSVLRKAESLSPLALSPLALSPKELALIQRLVDYPAAVRQAGDEFSPAVIANYAYSLACDFNSFYHDHSILNEADAEKRALRLVLAQTVANVIKSAMSLLGIEVPNRM